MVITQIRVSEQMTERAGRTAQLCRPFLGYSDAAVVLLQVSASLVAPELTAVLMAFPIVPAAIAISVVGRTVGTVSIAVSVMLLFAPFSQGRT